MEANLKTEERNTLMDLYEKLGLEEAGISIESFLADPWKILRKIGMGEIQANISWIKPALIFH